MSSGHKFSKPRLKKLLKPNGRQQGRLAEFKEHQMAIEIDHKRQEENGKRNLGFATFGNWWDESSRVTEALGSHLENEVNLHFVWRIKGENMCEMPWQTLIRNNYV